KAPRIVRQARTSPAYFGQIDFGRLSDRVEYLEFWRRQHSKGRQIALGFMIGSTCFALGSLPLYFEHVDARVVAVTFFAGSIFFTAAAFGQLTDAITVRHAHRGERPRSWRVWRW